MRRLALVASVLLVPAALACSAIASDDASQEADHKEGQITFAQYKWLWADESVDEFQKNAAATAGWFGAPEFLPLDHPMAQRLQFWVDQMDTQLRAKLGAELVNTPPPRVILKKDSEPNAWVTFMPVAWQVPSRLARIAEAGVPDAALDADPDAAPLPPPPAQPFYVDRTGSVVSPYGAPLSRAHDQQSLGELVKFFDDGFSRCRLSVDGEGVFFSDACRVDTSITVNRSETLGYYATSKWVTVTTGLVLSMGDEDRIVAVIAHELGHYYRTHSALPSDLLNYFYPLGDANVADKPGPDPRYLDQTQKVRDKLRDNAWFVDWTEENKLMSEQRLGFYTTEQEADEISLEVLTRIGMPPTLGPDSMLELHKIVEDLGGEGDSGLIGWQKCSMLRDSGWKGDDGQPVSVPVGNLSDPHHSFCFRVFNMTRELAAHKYQVVNARPQPPGDTWVHALARLTNDVDPPPAPPPPPPPADAGADAADAGPPPPNL